MASVSEERIDEGAGSTAGTSLQHAYDQLRSLVVSGAIGAGERLDERKLATQIGVSRTPVREAVGRLASEGIVEHRPFQGNFVRILGAEEVADLYEVRRELEGLAARLAAARMSPRDLDELEGIIRRCREAYEKADWGEFERLDSQFHQFIAASAANEVLVENLARLGTKIQLLRHEANAMDGFAGRTLFERDAVLLALRRRDGEAASHFMKLHISGAQEAAMAALAGRTSEDHQVKRARTR